MATPLNSSAISHSREEADSRCWHSPPSMPSPIPHRDGSEALLEESAISTAGQESYDRDSAAPAAWRPQTPYQGWTWSYGAATSVTEWPATRVSNQACEGPWSQTAGSWSQSGWQQACATGRWDESSTRPSHSAGWGTVSWRASATGRAPYSVNHGGRWGQQRESTSRPTSRPWTREGLSSQAAQQAANQGSTTGLNFAQNPFFPELPPGSPAFKLVQRLREFGLPRDPATWLRWQRFFFPEQQFTTLPAGWIRVWDEIGGGIACFRESDGATLLGASHTHFPSEEEWRRRPRRGQPNARPGAKKRSARGRLLDNIRSARFEADHAPPGAEEGSEESDWEQRPDRGQPDRQSAHGQAHADVRGLGSPAAEGWANPPAPERRWAEEERGKAAAAPRPLRRAESASARTVALETETCWPKPQPGAVRPTEEAPTPQAPLIPAPPPPEDWTGQMVCPPPVRAVASPLVWYMLCRPGGAISLPWKVPKWTSDSGPALRDLCLKFPVDHYPVFHILASQTAERLAPHGSPAPWTGVDWERACPQTAALTLNQFPWDDMLTGIVTRAAEARGLLPSQKSEMGFAGFRELLHSWGLLSREGFRAHMAGFAGRQQVREILTLSNVSCAQLAKLCVPGAWLLDTTFTLVQVMRGKARPSCAFVAVANTAHIVLLDFCFADLMGGTEGGASGNRGNQVEALAWLTLEADRTDLLLAMAYHLDLWSKWPHGDDLLPMSSMQGGAQDLRSDARDRIDLAEFLARSKKAAWEGTGAAPSRFPQDVPQPAGGSNRGGQLQAPRIPFKPPPLLKPAGMALPTAQFGLRPKMGGAATSTNGALQF